MPNYGGVTVPLSEAQLQLLGDLLRDPAPGVLPE